MNQMGLDWNLHGLMSSQNYAELALKFAQDCRTARGSQTQEFRNRLRESPFLRYLVYFEPMAAALMPRFGIYRVLRRPRRCVGCGAVPLSKYLYGMPSADYMLNSTDPVVLGGCGLTEDPALYHCNSCEADYYGGLELIQSGETLAAGLELGEISRVQDLQMLLRSAPVKSIRLLGGAPGDLWEEAIRTICISNELKFPPKCIRLSNKKGR